MLVSFLPAHLKLQAERDFSQGMVFLFEIYPVQSPQSHETPGKQVGKCHPQAQMENRFGVAAAVTNPVVLVQNDLLVITMPVL